MSLAYPDGLTGRLLNQPSILEKLAAWSPFSLPVSLYRRLLSAESRSSPTSVQPRLLVMPLAIAILLLATTTQSANEPAEELLAHYADAVASLKNISFVGTVTNRSTYSEFVLDGSFEWQRVADRISSSLQHSTYSVDEPENIRVSRSAHILWSASEVIYYELAGESPPLITRMSPEEVSAGSIMEDVLMGGELIDGYLAEFDDTLPALLRQSETLTLSESSMIVDGHATLMLTGLREDGEIVLWLDSTVGYHPRRIVLRKQGGVESVEETVVDRIEFCLVQSRYVPNRATITKRLKSRLDDATTDVAVTVDYERSKITFPEELAADSSFRIEAPDGTPVVDRSVPQIRMEWRDGQAVPIFYPETLDNMDSVVADVRSGAVETSIAYPHLGQQSDGLVARRPSKRRVVQPGEIYLATPKEPYCGVRSLYVALRLLKADVRYDELLTTEFISKPGGSSLSDLQTAAQRSGKAALPIMRLPIRSLLTSKFPAILHVASKPGSGEFDHFILFLGIHKGGFLIYDAPGPIQIVSASELRRRWSGTALFIVNDTTTTATTILSPTIVFFGAWSLAVVSVLLLLGVLYRTCFRFRRFDSGSSVIRGSAIESGLITAFAFALAFSWNIVGTAGTASTPVSWCSTPSFENLPLRRVDVETVRQLLDNGAVAIDARYPSDFRPGHIDGAVNVPPYLGKADRAHRLDGIDKSRSLVVYCQGPRCPFAESVARQLHYEGHTNVLLFEGGWEEWQSHLEDQK